MLQAGAERKTIAPRLPHVMVRVVKENASNISFLTVATITDHVAHLARQDGWQPKPEELALLKRRVLAHLTMMPDIDAKVRIVESFTLRKQKQYKIYYNA